MKPPSGVALLLSQLGAHVSKRFAERLSALELTPAHVGVLRVVATTPGIDQRTLATRLGVVPSRIVALVDELEDKGIVERVRSTSDRRQYELRVAEGANEKRLAVMRAVSAHDADVVAGLEPDEVTMLATLLGKVAASQGLPVQEPAGSGSPRRRRGSG